MYYMYKLVIAECYLHDFEANEAIKPSRMLFYTSEYKKK